MQPNWKRLIGTASLCLALLAPLPLHALTEPVLISAPIETGILSPDTLIITGELVMEDLEGGLYAVDGYRLIGEPEELAAHVGNQVVVSGRLNYDVSIFMTKAIDVDLIQAVNADELLRITGEVVYEDLEGGFFAVDGYRLIGDAETIAPLLGQQVLVVGTGSDTMSIFMTKAIDVISISLAVEAESPELQPVIAIRPLPYVVTVDGVTADFTPNLLVQDGALMVPLRAVVDLVGGKVAWSDLTRMASVELPTSKVAISVNTAEVVVRQTETVDSIQNVVALAKAPQIIDNRLYVSADSLSSIFGLMAQDADDNTLVLVASPATSAPCPQLPDNQANQATLRGSIRQVNSAEKTRILVEGEIMANGNALLIRLSVDDCTEILWDDLRTATLDDLTVGKMVLATLSGPVMTSYPAQGGASAVTILE